MHISMNTHDIFLIVALVLAIVATFNVTGRFNCLAASWTAYLIALFFTTGHV